ncbi:MAG: hypothetical protein ABUL72_02260, partial [Armatimonadota bacterium]
PLEKVKSGLKLRTQLAEGALSLRVGTRKYELPFEARLIKSDDYIFIHIPPSAEILKFEGKEVRVVTDATEAEKAASGFRKRRKRSKTAKAPAEIPTEIKDLLEKIPSGYKIAYGADGSPKVIKARKRRK